MRKSLLPSHQQDRYIKVADIEDAEGGEYTKQELLSLGET